MPVASDVRKTEAAAVAMENEEHDITRTANVAAEKRTGGMGNEQ